MNIRSYCIFALNIAFFSLSSMPWMYCVYTYRSTFFWQFYYSAWHELTITYHILNIWLSLTVPYYKQYYHEHIYTNTLTLLFEYLHRFLQVGFLEGYVHSVWFLFYFCFVLEQFHTYRIAASIIQITEFVIWISIFSYIAMVQWSKSGS